MRPLPTKVVPPRISILIRGRTGSDGRAARRPRSVGATGGAQHDAPEASAKTCRTSRSFAVSALRRQQAGSAAVPADRLAAMIGLGLDEAEWSPLAQPIEDGLALGGRALVHAGHFPPGAALNPSTDGRF